MALHFAAMECFRRSMIKEQPSDIAGKMRKDGANLARGMADMLEALDRKRGKGPQVVRVERVVVHQGGKAIVGNVAASAEPSEPHESAPPAIEHVASGITLSDLVGANADPVQADRDWGEG
jgi:hypothetical protein